MAAASFHVLCHPVPVLPLRQDSPPEAGGSCCLYLCLCSFFSSRADTLPMLNLLAPAPCPRPSLMLKWIKCQLSLCAQLSTGVLNPIFFLHAERFCTALHCHFSPLNGFFLSACKHAVMYSFCKILHCFHIRHQLLPHFSFIAKFQLVVT